MAIRAQQFLNRQLHRKGLTVRMKRHFQGGAYLWMLNASCERHGEGVGICDPGCGLTAPVRLFTWPEAVNSGGALRRIGLGRIFQIRHPSMVHFLGDPALMPDVTVAAALVKRREDPLHLGRATGRSREPRSAIPACVDVGCRVSRADIRQPGASRLEPPNYLKGNALPIRKVVLGVGPPGGERLLIPAGNSPLLQVGGILGPAAWFDTGPDSSRVTAGLRNMALKPVMTVRLIGAAP